MEHASLAIPAGDPARPRLLVSMRVDEDARVDDRMAIEVATAIRDIWKPYVDVLVGKSGDVHRTIEVDELQVVITGRTLARGREEGLGWIEFVDNRPLRTITVSAGAAARLMAASEWRGKPLTALPPSAQRQFMVNALSRSVAHEMGHYLLRSKEHRARGLMRDHLTANDIMERRGALYLLEPDQTAVLWQTVTQLARDSSGLPASD